MPDLQARTLLVEYPEGDTEGLVVLDFGGFPTTLRLKGTGVKGLLEECLAYYQQCPPLTWGMIQELFPPTTS